MQIDTHAPVTTASTVPDVEQQRRRAHPLARPTTSRASTRRTTRSTAARCRPATRSCSTTEGIHTVQFWSTDSAGNVEAANTATVRIDKTAPTITSRSDPAANAAGWNNTERHRHLHVWRLALGRRVVLDAADDHLRRRGPDGDRQRDRRGRQHRFGDARSVNIDETPPTIHGSVPAANANGWYNAPVTRLVRVCRRALGRRVVPGSDHAVESDGAGQSVSGTAIDAADNTRVGDGQRHQHRPDAADDHRVGRPRRRTERVGTTAAVTVHFTCSDATSGVAAGDCPRRSDRHGRRHLDGCRHGDRPRRQLRRPRRSSCASTRSRPASRVRRRRPPNGAGWNNTDVTVSFVCTDAGSGIAIAGCSPPTTLDRRRRAVGDRAPRSTPPATPRPRR